MGDKAKFITIALVIILATSIALNLQTFISKKLVEQERNKLKKVNTSLTEKLDETLKNNRRLEERLSSLSEELDKISAEKVEVEKNLARIIEERQDLFNQLTRQETQVQKEPVSEDAYWAGILKEKTSLELKIEEMLTELKNLKLSNDEIKKDKEILELDLKNLNSEKERTEQELSYHRKMLDNMVAELVQEKNAKRQYQDAVKPLQKENMELRQKLKSLAKQNSRMETKVAQLQEEKTAIERKFNEMGMLLEYRLSQVNDLKQQLDSIRSGSSTSFDTTLSPRQEKETVELPPIIVHPQSGAIMQQPSSNVETTPALGKVLAINEENNFLIMDVGSNAGVKVGDAFSVYRGGSLVAKIEVIQLRKDIAACDIKKQILPIKVGDVIR